MTMSVILLIASLMIASGSLTPTPVITINSPDGDVIDCIKIMEQVAFTNPLLLNHRLQEFPSGMPKPDEEKETVRQIWHDTGLKCPTGTIPVRRESAQTTDLAYDKAHPKFYDIPLNATRNHKYAVAINRNQGKIYGTQATLNVWEPKVESSDDFSLAQIWVASGSYNTKDLNTVEAGWVVFREKFLDNQPRLFTFWTSDAYDTYCSPSPCPGFVQTNNKVAVHAAINHTSTYGGPQFDITLRIWKDLVSGNWWLGMGLTTIEPIGYWPGIIFTSLADYATNVNWGGEVLYRNTSGMSMTVQMGSGEFAARGFRWSAYFCNLKVAQDNDILLPVRDFDIHADYPQYYTVKKVHNKECGEHFFYGGPGPGPMSSTAVRKSFELFLAFFYFVFLVFA